MVLLYCPIIPHCDENEKWSATRNGPVTIPLVGCGYGPGGLIWHIPQRAESARRTDNLELMSLAKKRGHLRVERRRYDRGEFPSGCRRSRTRSEERRVGKGGSS